MHSLPHRFIRNNHKCKQQMFNLNNTKQAQMFGNSGNIWNGNYWSDYKGVDLNIAPKNRKPFIYQKPFKHLRLSVATKN